MNKAYLPSEDKPSFSIKEVGIEKASVIYAITHSAFLEYATDVPPPSALLETEDEVYQEIMTGTNVLMAELVDGKSCGCVRYEIDKESLHFFRLAVAPSYRLKGIASSLLTEVEKRAVLAGCTRIWCHVRTQVTKNVVLYEKRGYVIVGEEVQLRSGFSLRVAVMEKILQ
jgi:ribosomal protein S18 acetylase RimI-like enzyme